LATCCAAATVSAASISCSTFWAFADAWLRRSRRAAACAASGQTKTPQSRLANPHPRHALGRAVALQLPQLVQCGVHIVLGEVALVRHVAILDCEPQQLSNPLRRQVARHAGRVIPALLLIVKCGGVALGPEQQRLWQCTCGVRALPHDGVRGCSARRCRAQSRLSAGVQVGMGLVVGCERGGEARLISRCLVGHACQAAFDSAQR